MLSLQFFVELLHDRVCRAVPSRAFGALTTPPFFLQQSLWSCTCLAEKCGAKLKNVERNLYVYILLLFLVETNAHMLHSTLSVLKNRRLGLSILLLQKLTSYLPSARADFTRTLTVACSPHCPLLAQTSHAH